MGYPEHSEYYKYPQIQLILILQAYRRWVPGADIMVILQMMNLTSREVKGHRKLGNAPSTTHSFSHSSQWLLDLGLNQSFSEHLL